MRIMMYVHIGPDRLWHIGGVENSTRLLIKHLPDRGVDASIAYYSRQPSNRSFGPEFPEFFVTPHTDLSIKRPRSFLSVARSTLQLVSYLVQWQANVLHVQFSSNQTLTALLASYLPRRWKLVTTLRGSEIMVRPLTDIVHRRRLARLLNRCDAVVGISRAISSAAQPNVGFPSDRVNIIPNGVEDFWFEPADESLTGQPFLLYVGRLHSVKGVDVLVHAMAEVVQKVPTARLLIVGDGPECGALRSLVQQLKLESSVTFLGPILEREELQRLYGGARAVVLPSRSEGLSLVALEAGACGAICVATQVGGLPEVISHGETGFLVPPQDATALAQALLHVLSLSDAERARLSENARQRVWENFRMEKTVRQYLQLYEEVCSRRKTSVSSSTIRK